MLFTLSQSLKAPSPSEDPDAVKALFGLNLRSRSQHKFHIQMLIFYLLFLVSLICKQLCSIYKQRAILEYLYLHMFIQSLSTFQLSRVKLRCLELFKFLLQIFVVHLWVYLQYVWSIPECMLFLACLTRHYLTFYFQLLHMFVWNLDIWISDRYLFSFLA